MEGVMEDEVDVVLGVVEVDFHVFASWDQLYLLVLRKSEEKAVVLDFTAVWKRETLELSIAKRVVKIFISALLLYLLCLVCDNLEFWESILKDGFIDLLIVEYGHLTS